MVEPPHQGGKKKKLRKIKGKNFSQIKACFKSITSNKNKEKENWKLKTKNFRKKKSNPKLSYQPQNTAFQGMFWDASPGLPWDTSSSIMWPMGGSVPRSTSPLCRFHLPGAFLVWHLKGLQKKNWDVGVIILDFWVVMGLSLIFGLLGVLRSC